ncbi:uncharacterized protein G2W53_022288 [Senna tora]|uniref:Uncharacterized protein n=1 Tax=Senna tora TaxID=362788 RepID=A0A834TU54_9FABA|nr:uncharacterized protein G2W53_022288 [Senna tora]
MIKNIPKVIMNAQIPSPKAATFSNISHHDQEYFQGYYHEGISILSQGSKKTTYAQASQRASEASERISLPCFIQLEVRFPPSERKTISPKTLPDSMVHATSRGIADNIWKEIDAKLKKLPKIVEYRAGISTSRLDRLESSFSGITKAVNALTRSVERLQHAFAM